MPIVDSHVHVSPAWFEPVDALLYHMDQNDVDQAVLLQIYGQYKHDYLFDCARRFPDRLPAVVVNVHVDAPDAVQTLERLADQGASGVRFRSTTRSPGEDPLAVWRAAERLGLSISVGGFRAELSAPEFAEIVQAVPKAPIILEHLGADGGGRDPLDLEAHRKVFELARYAHVYMRFHGLGEFCKRAIPVVEPFPFEQPIPPLLEMAYAAFGPSRMMWGSDYAPVSIREGYRNSLRLPMEQFASKSEDARELLFGRVALTVFPARR